MALFQNSVLRNHLKNIDKSLVLQAFETYRKAFLPKIENIKTSKEEQYQYGFLDDLFVKVLGYTLNPTPNYNLIAEQKNLSDSKKADGAILKDDKVIAVIELKSTKTKSMDKIVNQAFNYKHNHPACKYIITSNFEKLRLYVEHSDTYEEFNLFDLNEERFTLLFTLLSKENIFSDVALQLKEQSKLQEENISNELYKKYAELRTILFDNIIHNNPEVDKYVLLEKTQTILDRMVFIFFAEDRGILPPNTIRAIIDHYKGDIEDRELWHFYKIYFKAINEGNKKLNIPEYNGGLFTTDELLDSLRIDNDVIEACPLALSAYDFNSDIDVNILGHIFENSLNDIEELKARIEDADFDAKQSKRKKDGVFYTPEYITKYIVDNTLGTLCQAKKEALGLDDVDILVPKNPKKLNKGESKQKEVLEVYREYLLGLKILDPACGSGAFLNQALNYLLEEHAFIDESVKTLMGGSVLGLYDVKKDILENNLYGVDINAEAVEIAKLSLWLRTVESGRKLNKLADKIKVGNSLIDDKSVADDAFIWEEEFSEVFEQGGFDVVIGNPPYVRHENITKIKPALEKYISYAGTADLFVYFFELASKLLKEKGLNGYICSNKFFNATYAKNLRKYILGNMKIEQIIDFDGKQVFSDAIVESTVTIFGKSIADKEHKFKIINADLIESYKMKQFDLNTSSFTLLNPYKMLLKHKIEKIGVPLKQWDIEIKSGIKTGFNEAYIIDGKKKDELIQKDPKNSEIIKPLLRGRDVRRYGYEFADKWLIVAEYESHKYLEDKYPLIYEHLLGYQKELSKRGQCTNRGGKGQHHWLELDNNPSKNYFDLLKKEKIMWLELTDNPKFTLDKNGYFVDMTVFFITGQKLNYLLALLNSKAVFWYFDLICNESGVGTNRWKKTYVEQLPIPSATDNTETLLIENTELLIDLNKTFQTKKTKFLNRITDNFDLDKLSKKLEAFYETDFKTFLKELKKKKVTLTLKEQDEWEEYFETYQKELLDIQVQIDTTDKQIDEMVYALYGLSEDEVAVVEGLK